MRVFGESVTGGPAGAPRGVHAGGEARTGAPRTPPRTGVCMIPMKVVETVQIEAKARRLTTRGKVFTELSAHLVFEARFGLPCYQYQRVGSVGRFARGNIRAYLVSILKSLYVKDR